MNLLTKQRLTDLENELPVACTHTAVFKMDNQQGPTVYNTELCSVLYGSLAWMGGEFGRERIHVYAWLSPFTAHLKLSKHC